MFFNNGTTCVTFLDDETIGITEAKNKYGKEFGEDRVKKLLIENHDDLLEQIVRKLNSFIYEEQMDDFAAVLIDIE